VPSESGRARYNGQILADLLSQEGPLALDLCLRYATDIALALREMHQEGRSHGSVDPAHVLIRQSGLTLLAFERRGYPDPLGDLSGFGAVLFAMLMGRPPSSEEMRLVPAKPASLNGAASVRAEAVRLAERCLTADRETAPDLQKILTEVRLLHVRAKQLGAEQLGIHIAPPPPVTFPPPQRLEVYAGKAAPVIYPPAVSPQTADAATPPDPAKPGEHSTQTRRAKGSHSRPVLQDVMCPKCKGYHVRLSRPRTRFERLLNLLGIGVHRCHRCFYRYVPFFGRKFVRRSK
jgi:hypothetical protein